MSEGQFLKLFLLLKRSRSSSFAFSSQCIGHSLIARAPLCAAFCDRELKTADGHPFSLITLDAYSVSAFEAFHLRSVEELYEAVKALQKGVRCGTVGDFAQTAVIDAEAPGSDSEGEEEDEPALS
jgi:hypothetical protein